MLGNSAQECEDAIVWLGNKLSVLGFKINVAKSQFTPSKLIKFLGFMVDSSTMRVYLPLDKCEKMGNCCNDVLNKKPCKIQEVASLVGLMTSYRKALDYSENHIKKVEKEKILALAANGDDYDAFMVVSKQGREDAIWWKENCFTGFRKIRTLSTELTLVTVASNEGWGALCKGKSSQGKWLVSEANLHINAKELLAVLFGLKSLCNQVSNTVILILSDNTTTVSYVNNMGGITSKSCNRVAHLIWSWCESQGNWLIAAHIPGKDNDIADGLSRNFSNNVDWQLSDEIFRIICTRFGTPSVDLFANRENTKLRKFCTWKADPDAWQIDAFSFPWVNDFYYLFPPFRLVGKVWRKVMEEKTHGVLVVPRWPSQMWYASVLKSARRTLFFQRRKGNLFHPKEQLITNSLSHIPLIACLF